MSSSLCKAHAPRSFSFPEASPAFFCGIVSGFLILCSVIVAPGGGHLLSNPDPFSISRAESSGESSLDTWIFPNASYSDLRNASLLSDFLSSKLSSGPTHYLIGSIDASKVLFRNPPSLDPFLDNYLISEPSVVFSSSDGSIFELFYDHVSASLVNSENGSASDVEFGSGTFLGFAASLSNSAYFANDEPEFESTVREVAQSLGIPAIGMASVTTTRQDDRVTVVLSSQLLGHAVAGCNIVSGEFQIPGGRLVKFQSRPYLALPQSFATSEAAAIENARATVPSLYGSGEKVRIASDGIIGVRAQPFHDQGDRSPESNISLPVVAKMEFGFGFEYVANISSNSFSTNYAVIVVVDVDSGKVLVSKRAPTPTPSGHGILTFLDGWELVLAGSLIMVGVLAIVLLGPAESAIILLGLLVPLRVRLSGGMDVLDNFNRGRIFEHVKNNPGCSFSELKEGLRLHNGNLAYHLAVLERLGLIRSVKDGWARRYAVQGADEVLPLNRLLGNTEWLVLKVLASKGPLAESGIARELDISRQRAHYHLKRLLKRGLVEHAAFGWAVMSEIVERVESTDDEFSTQI
jgi:predicted transcriptional regulator